MRYLLVFDIYRHYETFSRKSEFLSKRAILFPGLGEKFFSSLMGITSDIFGSLKLMKNFNISVFCYSKSFTLLNLARGINSGRSPLVFFQFLSDYRANPSFHFLVQRLIGLRQSRVPVPASASNFFVLLQSWTRLKALSIFFTFETFFPSIFHGFQQIGCSKSPNDPFFTIFFSK